MAAIDDLTAAVGNLESAASSVATEVAALKSADNETALESLATRITAVVTTLQGLVPPPAPAPAPAPAS